MPCKCAPSLKKLLDDTTKRFPRRSRLSDGCCGDEAHAARKSDHNADSSGYAHAADITNDPANGVDCNDFVEPLLNDHRVKYVIWQRGIYYPSTGRKDYKGANPHDKHLHISIKPDAHHDLSPWRIFVEPQASSQHPDAIHHSGFDSPNAADSLEAPTDAALIATSESSAAEKTQPTPIESPQQTILEGGTGVIVQPNALAAALPIVPLSEPAIDVQTVTPEKSGAKKSIWATIAAGITFLGLNIQAFFSNVYATVKDNPAAALGLIVGCLVIVVVYWKFQERQTKLDEQREKQAFELTKLQMQLAADQTKYGVNLVKADK